MTEEEQRLLQKLASGALDGRVGDYHFSDTGSTYWKTIENGIPAHYKRGPGGKFFNGKENERYEGALTRINRWTTDEEKIAFLRNYGYKIQDQDVKAYSAKFKPSRENRQHES